MFKVYIPDSVYDRIISAEEQRATARRSNSVNIFHDVFIGSRCIIGNMTEICHNIDSGSIVQFNS